LNDVCSSPAIRFDISKTHSEIQDAEARILFLSVTSCRLCRFILPAVSDQQQGSARPVSGALLFPRDEVPSGNAVRCGCHWRAELSGIAAEVQSGETRGLG